LARLHTDRSALRWPDSTRGRAPHKPLLLLAALDLFAAGRIAGNLIEPGPELGEQFTSYWGRVMPPTTRGNLALPFFHLRSDGFWHLLPRPGQETGLAGATQIRSMTQLRDMVLGARLDEELFALLGSAEGRVALREALLTTYFDATAGAALRSQIATNQDAFAYSQLLLDQARRHEIKETLPQAEQYAIPVRDQGFRRAVVTAYGHRCALCGVRVLTLEGHTAVSAAHIIPWSLSHNDDPRNGMALCGLCHWVFDEGLIGVAPSYLVILSPQLGVGENVPGHLQTVARRPILAPQERRLWPDEDALAWHQREVFQPR
jgi:putative restriction endonuclease